MMQFFNPIIHVSTAAIDFLTRSGLIVRLVTT
jgi:hypothetical protein